MLLEVAQVIAKRSTCSRRAVGAVLSREGRILSTGYNGAPAGMDHCDHTIDDDPAITCPYVIHAEANAILFAAKHGVATEGADLYTTLTPCDNCAKMIINAGILRVLALERYPRSSAGVALLTKAGIQWEVYDDMRGIHPHYWPENLEA